MKLLTNGKLMYMIIEDRVYIEDLPLSFDDMNWEYDWEQQNPDMKSIKDIRREFPFLFNKKHPFYTPKLKLIMINK